MENQSFGTIKSSENITNLAKANKVEKSQAELRDILKERFSSMEKTIKQEINEYKISLTNKTFEDKEGEEEGSGNKRKELIQTKINALFDKALQIKEKINGKDLLSQYTDEIEAIYNTETITLNLDQKLEEYIEFYKKINLDLPFDFENTIRDIWGRNQNEISEVIEKNGFNDILIIPPTEDLSILSEKMKMENGNWTSSNFDEGGGFEKAQSQNIDKTRIVLVHKTQNLKDHPELSKTLNIKGEDVDMKNTLTLEDYLVFQRKYFEETGKHLDEDGWTWLATKSGSRLVSSAWAPGDGQLHVDADGLDFRLDNLGARPSRSFF